MLWELRKFALDLIVVIFFKNAEKITIVGSIKYLENYNDLIKCKLSTFPKQMDRAIVEDFPGHTESKLGISK